MWVTMTIVHSKIKFGLTLLSIININDFILTLRDLLQGRLIKYFNKACIFRYVNFIFIQFQRL